jgi:Family of unknown function (DUF5872)
MPHNYDRADRLASMLAQGGHQAEVARDLIEKLAIEDDENHESIEDILRHDKGHDDWHAAHGDPPCKSEADCARMRASYDDDDGAGVVKKVEYDKVISDKKGEPTDEALYSRVIEAAKKKFDVYPSAVANGWVVQEYKRRGGTYSVQKSTDGSFTPPKSVQAEAQRALEWLKQDEQGGGFSSVGRKRASDLAAGHAVSLDTIKRMNSFFARHEVDKKGEGFSPGGEGYPSPGRVAWAAWGGDAGWTWAKSVLDQHDSVTKGGGDQPRDEHSRWAISSGVGEANRASFSIGRAASNVLSDGEGLKLGTKDYQNVRDLRQAEFRASQGLRESRNSNAAGAVDHYTATRDIIQGVKDRGSSGGADISSLDDAHARLTGLIDVHAAEASKDFKVDIAKLEHDISLGGFVAEVARDILAKYNSDQARDEHGRFASGSSGSGPDSGSGTQFSNHTAEEMRTANTVAEALVNYQGYNNLDPQSRQHISDLLEENAYRSKTGFPNAGPGSNYSGSNDLSDSAKREAAAQKVESFKNGDERHDAAHDTAAAAIRGGASAEDMRDIARMATEAALDSSKSASDPLFTDAMHTATAYHLGAKALDS